MPGNKPLVVVFLIKSVPFPLCHGNIFTVKKANYVVLALVFSSTKL